MGHSSKLFYSLKIPPQLAGELLVLWPWVHYRVFRNHTLFAHTSLYWQKIFNWPKSFDSQHITVAILTICGLEYSFEAQNSHGVLWFFGNLFFEQAFTKTTYCVLTPWQQPMQVRCIHGPCQQTCHSSVSWFPNSIRDHQYFWDGFGQAIFALRLILLWVSWPRNSFFFRVASIVS